MPVPLIISVSGLRGEIGVTLTPEVAARYAAAFSATLSDSRPFVITRDGRAGSELLADAVSAALCSVGRSVVDAGIAATPTTGVLIRQLGAAGGIQISASHNPRQFNGLKLFNAAGRVIPKAEGEAVLPLYDSFKTGRLPWADVDHLGKRTLRNEVTQTTRAHLDAVLATVDVDAIRGKRFRVLLDSNHGAGSLLGRRLLEALGCQIVGVGQTPDGAFEHTPEPTAENLAPILRVVRQAGSEAKIDAAFCQDPDADRLAIIDENARYIGEEYTLAICVKNRLAKKAGPVVINSATSRMTIDIAESFGQECFRAPVGEANVVDCMIARGAVFGGEGNGGPIDPRVGYVRDSFVAMAMTLETMALTGEPLSRLADALPSYAIIKRKVTLPADRIAAVLDGLAKKYAGEKVDRSDGVRVDFSRSWALVRASNTEPIARIIVEAPEQAAAEALCDRFRRDTEALLDDK